MDKLKRDLEFLKIVDKTKNILRMTKHIDSEQREDVAQHSFQIAVMAMVLEEYSDVKIDIDKVIKMLLIHDLVEVYAGDTFAYDEKDKEDQEEREIEAADKIFSINEKGRDFRKLWNEFEDMKTSESVFANAIDRIQPILQNYYNKGGTWKEKGISTSQVYKRIEPVKMSSKILYELLSQVIDDSEKRGWLIDG